MTDVIPSPPQAAEPQAPDVVAPRPNWQLSLVGSSIAVFGGASQRGPALYPNAHVSTRKETQCR
ncbi:MAG TPA: hypothetical protein VHZ78_14385 [Rhizomicrobium sp.]|jgi:hypothetical protein|nr:hypothetical protein [Rhizomicrobium sp.]